MADDDLIPHAGTPININWTSSGCYIGGDSYQPQKIKGGYPMMVNGKMKTMTYRVSYQGEWYYFAA